MHHGASRERRARVVRCAGSHPVCRTGGDHRRRHKKFQLTAGIGRAEEYESSVGTVFHLSALLTLFQVEAKVGSFVSDPRGFGVSCLPQRLGERSRGQT
jgi:hypothetical protein